MVCCAVLGALAAGRPAAKGPSTVSPQVQMLDTAFFVPQRRYSVLYLHDGGNVFDAAMAFAGGWGVDETLDRFRASGQDPTGCTTSADPNSHAIQVLLLKRGPSAHGIG